jgi:hypothetical protein
VTFFREARGCLAIVLRVSQTAATSFAKIGQMLFGMRQRCLALRAIRDDRGPALPAKFWRARGVVTVVAARAQAIQSHSHRFLLILRKGLPLPVSHAPGAIKIVPEERSSFSELENAGLPKEAM